MPLLNHILPIDFPIIQAPMAGTATTPQMIAATCNAGGLGSVPAGYLSGLQLSDFIDQVRQLTKKDFCVNVFVPNKIALSAEQLANAKKVISQLKIPFDFNININPPYAPSFDEQMKVILESKIKYLSFTFGIPETKWIKLLKSKKIFLMGTATSLAEATQLEEQGFDLIVAQSSEAGGHRGTFLSTEEETLTPLTDLIPQLIGSINIPVVAAGGIMNKKDIDSILLAGAAGVQMGTVFLTCKESGIHPHYKKLLLSNNKDATALTRVFTGKLARGIENLFMLDMEPYATSLLPYPAQHALTSDMRKQATLLGNTDYMSLWAGQRHYLCREKTVTEIMNELTSS